MLGKSPELKVTRDVGIKQRSSTCTCPIVILLPEHLLMATGGQVSGQEGPSVCFAT